ncbi:MAG: Wzz/FepE/Etk N-terminal domain-containing protein [Bacteroidota bacterium]
MENYFNNKGLIKLVGKWKFHIVIIVIIAIILGAVFSSSYFIKPRYKSIAVVYPSNLSPFSEESETEQMLQILQSDDIRDKIIETFNLAMHWELDTAHPYFRTIINGLYGENVSFRKTEYESIEIKVIDTEPKVASAIADSIIRFYDEKVAQLHKTKYLEVVQISLFDMNLKQKEIDSLQNRLKTMREAYGIMNYNIQVKEITKMVGNNNPEINKIYNGLKEMGGEYNLTDSLLWDCVDYMKSLKWSYDNALSGYNKNITYCHVVTRPYPADKKSYPIRWLIVLMSAGAALILSLIAIAVAESIRKKDK